jgi:hypothetical protein
MNGGSKRRWFPANKEVATFGALMIGLVLLGGISWASDSHSANSTGTATSPVLMPKLLGFEPERPVAGEAIKVKVTFASEPSEGPPLTYRWKVNDQVIQEAVSPEIRYPTKRGDVVEAAVFLGDTRDETRAFRKVLTVVNSPPAIKRSDERMDESGHYIAHFEISDPDGDAVTLELQKGPEGMTLEGEKRELRWSPPDGMKGTFAVEVLTSDNAGAHLLYSYSLTLK